MLRPSPTSPLFPYTTLFRSCSSLILGVRMSLKDAAYADQAFAKYADQLRPDLVPFLKLPKPEHPRVTRARLAQFLQHRFALTQRSEEHTSELQSRENLVCRL